MLLSLAEREDELILHLVAFPCVNFWLSACLDTLKVKVPDREEEERDIDEYLESFIRASSLFKPMIRANIKMN